MEKLPPFACSNRNSNVTDHVLERFSKPKASASTPREKNIQFLSSGRQYLQSFLHNVTMMSRIRQSNDILSRCAKGPREVQKRVQPVM